MNRMRINTLITKFVWGTIILAISVILLLNQEVLRSSSTHRNFDNFKDQRMSGKGNANTKTCSQQQRKAHLERMCAARDRTYDRRFPYTEFYVDEERKLGYCYIYKAGSTSWLNAFHVANGVKKLDSLEHAMIANPIGADAHFPKLLHNSSLNHVRYDPQLHAGLTKFIVVRHPFDRLVSAYYQKIADSVDVYFHSVRNLIKHLYYNESLNIRKTKRPIWTTLGKKIIGVTFAEYVRFIIAEATGNLRTDMLQKGHQSHFVSYFSLCNPCEIHYDYILHTETTSEDAPMILSLLGLPINFMDNVKFNVAHQRKMDILSTEKYLKEFEQLTADEIEKLLSIYKHDFALFGYGFYKNLTTSCSLSDCC